MICPNCQTTNANDANFCLNCSYRVSVICPRCSRRVLSHARFCDACGHALAGQALAGQAQFEAAAAPDRQSGPEPPAVVAPEADGIPIEREPKSEAQAPEPQPAEPAEDKDEDKARDRAAAADSPLAQYIPRELMKKLDAARSSGDMVGERRVVTMLFCPAWKC